MIIQIKIIFIDYLESKPKLEIQNSIPLHAKIKFKYNNNLICIKIEIKDKSHFKMKTNLRKY